MSINPIF